MLPDAIPIKPERSYVVLSAEMLGGLFGDGFRIRGTERVELLQSGRVAGMADVSLGESPSLFLDAGDRSALSAQQVKLRGPKGIRHAPVIRPIPAIVVLPEALMNAWNLSESQETTLLLGSVAIRAMVVLGASPHLSVDRTLLFAGDLARDVKARWAPDVAWENVSGNDEVPTEATKPSFRVITENDVRRARMLRKRIQIQEGQIVTPAARELAIELGVLDET